MNKQFIEEVQINNPIGNLYRKSHVLILVEKEDGSFILGKKKGFYPDHIARMIGGGIDPDEDSRVAAQREITEELTIDLALESFKKLFEVITRAKTSEGDMEMITHVYHVVVSNEDVKKITASDDLSDTSTYTKDEYLELINDMNKLDTDFVTDTFSFSWADWAKIYAPIHQYVIGEYKK
jgi:8-oxo-dGTP pyrophosphatase MutT (NUDIX family)